MQEIRVQSLGQEDPLEKEMANHSNILENPMDRGVCSSWSLKELGMTERVTLMIFQTLCLEPDSADRTMRFGSCSTLHSSNPG